jgi:hypothetical protein
VRGSNMQFDRGYISPRPLTKIDYYGKVLVGCIKCNRWAKPGGGKKLVLELMEDDLGALRATSE